MHVGCVQVAASAPLWNQRHASNLHCCMQAVPNNAAFAVRTCCGGCSGSYDLIGRVYASGAMGVPLALHVLSGDAGERVVYGDSRGAAVLLLCGSRELPARDLISTETHKVDADACAHWQLTYS